MVKKPDICSDSLQQSTVASSISSSNLASAAGEAGVREPDAVVLFLVFAIVTSPIEVNCGIEGHIHLQ
jgi:hypothetical protein